MIWLRTRFKDMIYWQKFKDNFQVEGLLVILDVQYYSIFRIYFESII